MLTKLIGYEMKAFGRIILPLYAATLGMALIMGLGVRFLDERFYSNFLGAMVVMAFVILIFATMIMTGVLSVQRFYRNLLGNEGYLMFSLPVGTHHLILSKVIGSLIWSFLSGAVAVCTVAIMGLAAVPLEDIMKMFGNIGEYISRYSLEKKIGQGVIWIFIMILFFAMSLMQIYTALAIGHQWSEHRIAGSVLAYFGIDMLKGLFGNILARIGYYTGWTELLAAQVENGNLPGWQIQAGAVLSAVVMIVIYGAATWYLLDRRINLE